MKRAIRYLLALALFHWAGAGLAAEDPAEEFRLTGVERVVAIADIHGAYEPFVSLLAGTGLVDAELRWSGGASHLVIVGDILDRGADSRRVLDLVMRLEGEAAAVAGAVHMVLGNHEVMNLVGELGYVSREEFAAYRDLESGADRRRAQSRFAAEAPGLSRLALRAAFGRQYPGGFFGHRAAFAADGVYGRWLLQQPVLLVINDTAFAHAGLSARLIAAGPRQANAEAAATLGGYLEAMRTLEEEGLLFPETGFHRHAGIVRDRLAGRGSADTPLNRAAAALEELGRRPLFAPDSVVWYRGMVDCSPAIEAERLRQAFDALEVRRLVIGHTPTRNHLVQERFDRSLLLADTGMLASHYGGQPAALIFEPEGLSVYYADSDTRTMPSPLPRLVGPRPLALGDAALESVLAEAELEVQRNLQDGRKLLRLRHPAGEFEALFQPALMQAGGTAVLPEVAAYRLDRLLEFELVPVAVKREVAGEVGALYLDADALITEAERPAEAAELAWCPLDDQFALMRVFDRLLGKPDRPPEQMRYSEGNWKLALTDNRDSLGMAAPITEGDALALSPGLRRQLEALDAAALAAALGEVLDPGRRQALLARRDALLEQALE